MSLREAFSIVNDGHQLSGFSTLIASYQSAQDVILAGVEGDMVEVGVFAGSQSAMMARAIQDNGGGRLVHLFDTFSGIPAGGHEDVGWDHPPGTSACSLGKVRENLARWGVSLATCRFYPGLVEETAPVFAETGTKIAILRVDCDLHGPTLAALRWLYPLVSSGGIIVSDDYGLPGARKAVDQYLLSEPIYWRKP